jgi:glycosyltransferase involved in cell wall biosynthesis
MRIALINVPYRTRIGDRETWITVPPQGYGGIQWLVANLTDGLLERGHLVYLLGAPGSPVINSNMVVVDAGTMEEIRQWLSGNSVNIVHDHSNGAAFNPEWRSDSPWVSSHHLTGRPRYPENVIYVSEAGRQAAGALAAPVIRVPVNPARYDFSQEKDDYLLFLGRVSKWKGALEAAQFASATKMKLVIAGPCWEDEYRNEIAARFGRYVEFAGNIGGEERKRLLSRAQAILVLSQPVLGPWGDIWCEPGATVVSEAAVSGTPVISTENGCLAEIVPHVGAIIPSGREVSAGEADAVLRNLPSPKVVRARAIQEWDYRKIAAQYEDVYNYVLRGGRW